MNSTHTYAIMKVSPSAYQEIRGKLKEAAYHHAIQGNVLDMHGIALAPSAGAVPPAKPVSYWWRDADQSIIPPTAPAEQRSECRRFFYLGARMMMTEMIKISSYDVSENEGVVRLDQMRQELDQFYSDMEAGKV